ncbi:MAG: T9SS C-terminal target domain-containing protein, partial [Ignavibacteria bacterium]|nr:T9SS C-terminal target domain-containing protein [Ignavibacteria bacterium]
MRKLFSILAFVLLYVGITLGQAFIDIPITISDNAVGSKVLNFGLDLTATDGIDPALGESDLPPFPPLGAFEARFWLPPYTASALTSYKDYRNAPAFPFTGPKEHRLKWQYSDFATSLTFTYNLPNSVQITITSNNATPLWTSGPRTGSGSYILDDPENSYSAARIQVVYTATIPVELVSFNAIVSGNSVNLSWQTAS